MWGSSIIQRCSDRYFLMGYLITALRTELS